ALAVVAGASAAAMSFRLLPPLSPAYRTRRLLALTLRDLRRLVSGRPPRDWEDHVYGRLSVLPDSAGPLERGRLLAALSMGSEILQVRPMASLLGFGAELDAALGTLAQGNSASARAQVAELDRHIASFPDPVGAPDLPMRARASLLVISESLARHSAFFDS